MDTIITDNITRYDWSRIKKHQYDLLVDSYHTAKHNNHIDLQWQGHTLLLKYAYHLIEYLSPKFKDIQ